MEEENKIIGSYSEEIILQITTPKIVDVSASDYLAEKLNINTGLVDNDGEIRPFILCAKEEVTLKIETWTGTVIVWTFPGGPYPMLLRRIFTDAGNSATTIQIGY